MAKNNINNYNPTKDSFGLSLNIQRGEPNPLDNTSVWQTLDEAKAYAVSGSTAYVGQILSVLDSQENVSGAPIVKAYLIKDEAGTLEEVGSTYDDTEIKKLIGTLPDTTDATNIVDYVDEAFTTVQNDIDNLENLVGTEATVEQDATGLVKEIQDLKTAVGKFTTEGGETSEDNLATGLSKDVEELRQGVDEAKEQSKSLGDESNEYSLKYKDDCFAMRRQSSTDLIEFKLTDNTASLSRYSGNPIVYADIINTKQTKIITNGDAASFNGNSESKTYDRLVANALRTTLTVGNSEFNLAFFDNFSYACDTVFDITNPTSDIDTDVTYVLLSENIYKISYTNGIPSDITIVCADNNGMGLIADRAGKSDLGCYGAEWFTSDLKPQTRKIVEAAQSTGTTDVKIAPVCTPISALNDYMFTPNNCHQFMIYKGQQDSRYYLIALGAKHQWASPTAPMTIEAGKFSKSNKGFELVENNTAVAAFNEAFAAYDLIKAFKGESNLVTNTQPFAILSKARNVFGTHPGTEWITEEELGTFTPNAEQTITYNQTTGAYQIDRVSPIGNYNIAKIQDFGRMYLDDGTSICVPDICCRGIKYGLHPEFPTLDLKKDIYVQVIFVRCWSYGEGSTRTWEEGLRIFYRTLEAKANPNDASLFRNWSYFHEFVTSDSITNITNSIIDQYVDEKQLVDSNVLNSAISTQFESLVNEKQLVDSTLLNYHVEALTTEIEELKKNEVNTVVIQKDTLLKTYSMSVDYNSTGPILSTAGVGSTAVPTFYDLLSCGRLVIFLSHTYEYRDSNGYYITDRFSLTSDEIESVYKDNNIIKIPARWVNATNGYSGTTSGSDDIEFPGQFTLDSSLVSDDTDATIYNIKTIDTASTTSLDAYCARSLSNQQTTINIKVINTNGYLEIGSGTDNCFGGISPEQQQNIKIYALK